MKSQPAKKQHAMAEREEQDCSGQKVADSHFKLRFLHRL
jgi:hypothetical protein